MKQKNYFVCIYVLVGILLSITANNANAQTAPKIKTIAKPKISGTRVDNKVYNVAEVQEKPIFPDGEAALFKYLADNLKYPAMARENGIEGTVYIEFVIDKDGSITEATVKRGIGGGCNEEALRLVNAMPKWIPGKKQGKPVKVKYTVPVKIKLQ